MQRSSRLDFTYVAGGLLLVLLLAACAATGGERVEQLDRTLWLYERAVRWSEFELAYSMHKQDAEVPSVPPAGLENIEVTGYVASNRVVNDDRTRATQVVQIRYVNREHMRERTIVDRQEWEYDSERKQWLLVSPPPELR